MTEKEKLDMMMKNTNEKIRQVFNPCESFQQMAAFVAVMEMTVSKIKDSVPEVAIVADALKELYVLDGKLRSVCVKMDEEGLGNDRVGTGV